MREYFIKCVCVYITLIGTRICINIMQEWILWKEYSAWFQINIFTVLQLILPHLADNYFEKLFQKSVPKIFLVNNHRIGIDENFFKMGCVFLGNTIFSEGF